MLRNTRKEKVIVIIKQRLIKKSQYKYSQSEKGRIQIQRANQKSNDSGYKKSWVKNRRNADLNFKIRMALRTRFNHMIVDHKLHKWNSSLLYIGCSVEFVMKHLESQFQEGMTWENYVEWHVDHKIPLSYFDLTIEENLYTAWNYRNLQPLWGRDNLKKSDSVPENVEQLVEQLKKEINDNN